LGTASFTGKGKAINKTVSLAEILKRQCIGCLQETVIFTEDVIDVWESNEANLDRFDLSFESITRQFNNIYKTESKSSDLYPAFELL
jgi:hypothetical protein